MHPWPLEKSAGEPTGKDLEILAANTPIRVLVEETLVGRSCDECRNFHAYPGPLGSRGDTQKSNIQQAYPKPKMRLVTNSMQMVVTVGYRGWEFGPSR